MKFRKGFWIYFPVALFAWISPIGVSTAKADSFTTTGAHDYFFTLNASQLFTVRTYAQQYGIDSQLWLYDSTNTVIAVNDDWFGLDSYISRNLNAGTYKLRTSVCCGEPNRWYGTSYVVDVNIAPSNTTTTSTTTTLPPLGMNTPTNLQAVAGFESVSLTWDAPQGGSGYAEVERYAVFFSSDNWQSSYAIASNTTSATVSNLTTGVTYQFRVRADNDTLHVYSSMIETFTASATPVTTTSSTISTTTTTTSTTTIPPTTSTTSTTTTSTVPQTTSTTTSSSSTTIPSNQPTTPTTIPQESSTSTTIPETTTSTTSTTSSTIYIPETTTNTTLVENPTSTTTTSTLPPVPEEIVEVPTGTTTTIVEEPMPEETIPEETTTTTEPMTTTTEASPDPTFEETTTTTLDLNLVPNLVPLTTEEINAVVEELATITEITPEVLNQVVDALNSDNITEEQVQTIVDAVVENLDTLTELTPEVLNQVLDILESDSVTQDQIQSIVDSVLATDISSDQATQLATSAAVLENITGDQATEVFASIDESSITDTQAAAIVEALLNAPAEVKQAFEAEINVFQGGFDNYIPTGSVISVGSRRVVVAVTTVSFVLPAPVVSRRKQRV
jgi:hypothetical protein